MVRREPKIFHPIRFFAGLALFLGGLFLSFGLQSTVNYMGSSILIILSMKTIGLDVQGAGFLGGLAAAIAGIVLLVMSSSRRVSEFGRSAAAGGDAGRRAARRPRRRILVYNGILWLAVLFLAFGAYVLFDPSTGTDIVKENVVEIIYLQLGAIYSLGIRFWVGSGIILLGLILLFRFSFAREDLIMETGRTENETKVEPEPMLPEGAAAPAGLVEAAGEHEAQPVKPVEITVESVEESEEAQASIAPAAENVGRQMAEKIPEAAVESGAKKYESRITELEEKLAELERQLVRQKLEDKRRKRKPS